MQKFLGPRHAFLPHDRLLKQVVNSFPFYFQATQLLLRKESNFMMRWNEKCFAANQLHEVVKRRTPFVSHIERETMYLSVFYNCNWPCHHRCHSLNPFMCCLSPFQFFTVSSHSTCRISPTRNSCLEWQRSLGLSSFPFLVHNAVPVFSNTRLNDTMVILKWVLSRFNQS